MALLVWIARHDRSIVQYIGKAFSGDAAVSKTAEQGSIPCAGASIIRASGGGGVSGRLDRAFEQGLRSGIEAAVPNMVDSCLDALWSHPWYGFIAGGQLRLIEAGMKPREAWELSKAVLVEHVRSEKIKFGDPGFNWGPQGGREIIEECEIEHWDAA